jgi:hypothetical protein
MHVITAAICLVSRCPLVLVNSVFSEVGCVFGIFIIVSGMVGLTKLKAEAMGSFTLADIRVDVRGPRYICFWS